MSRQPRAGFVVTTQATPDGKCQPFLVCINLQIAILELVSDLLKSGSSRTNGPRVHGNAAQAVNNLHSPASVFRALVATCSGDRARVFALHFAHRWRSCLCAPKCERRSVSKVTKARVSRLSSRSTYSEWFLFRLHL